MSLSTRSLRNILAKLANGVALDAALVEARRRGFAETNVSRDLSGDDAADKLRILARAAFVSQVDVEVRCGSLETYELACVGSATKTVVRQVAAFDSAHGATVTFEALTHDDFLARAKGEENRLIVTGADGREWHAKGKGAGRWPTAEAVIADLLDEVITTPSLTLPTKSSVAYQISSLY